MGLLEIFSVLIACSAIQPDTLESENLFVTSPLSQKPKSDLILLAGKRKAPGPDHGDDPNDEQHQDIPAWEERNKHRPPSDPYAGTTPNNRNDPYKPY